MAALSPALKVLARRLLAWDRQRLATIRVRYPEADVSAYKARQDLAAVCIDADVQSWPVEIVDLFHAVLEVTRRPGRVTANQEAIGRLGNPGTPRLSRAERIVYREFADRIGRIGSMRETHPALWTESLDVEGD